MSSTETSQNTYVRTLLLGVVMSFAILDHTRLFFHYWNTNPADLEHTTPGLFFTRFVSHYFAPAVFFLVGVELYLNGLSYTKKQHTFRLLKQGIFLLLIELFINNFLYTFDLYYRTIGLFILGLLGICFICLAGLHYLSRNSLLFLSLSIIGLHNFLDAFRLEDHSPLSITWYILHQQKFIPLDDRMYIVNYTLLPWLAVLLLGYFFGYYYWHGNARTLRKKILMYSGWISLGFFFLVRSLNIYADPKPWVIQPNGLFTILSFFDLTKYPASLAYLSLTLGPIFLFLGYVEGIQNKFTSFFYTFGKRPLFIYLISTFLIHAIAMLGLLIKDASPMRMVITPASYNSNSELHNYGYSLSVVYVIWLAFMLLFYFLCKLPSRNKVAHFPQQDSPQ
jgi:uncharacterized membrane protein